MTDPRTLSDRALLAYLVLGDLPPRGWSGNARRRAIAFRLVELVAIGTATWLVLVGLYRLLVTVLVMAG